MIGKKLAHYEILAKIGQGGMGEVYRAHDTKLRRDVALKILPGELSADPQRRARFEREAQAIAALNHPNVVTIHSVEEAEDQVFLVMELIEGQTLDQLIPPGGMKLAQFFELAIPLADSVAAAHAKGITHRDLKPGNVMIDAGGRVKVLDFGLAKLLEDPHVAQDATLTMEAPITREGVVMGTAAYMSPEQAEGKSVDARSDVFTLGVLLYEMATGQRPFQGDTHLSTMTALLRDDPRPAGELRPELPKQLARIIRRCLEKAPDRRYESASGVKYDLEILHEEYVTGEYEPATPRAGEMAPMTPTGPRRRGLWAGAVLVALIAVIALVWTQRPRSTQQTARVSATPEAPADPAQAVAPTLVVFPFENLGPPEDAYFAAGITDEITTRLGSVAGLRVLSRTSSQQYDRTGKTMQQVAADLGVDYVLDGAVRWQKTDASSRVRVTPQLVRAADDTQVWAQVFDRTMEEIFAVQSEIAGEVVHSLGGTLQVQTTDAQSAPPTQELSAYHAYLRAKELLKDRDFDVNDWRTATELLDRAVTLDPTFAEAYALLARCHAGFVHFGWDTRPERVDLAKAAADRARELDPDSPDSYVGRGYYFYWALKDYAPALEAFQKASAARPGDTDVMTDIAYVRRRQGRFAEAAADFEKVAALAPGDGSPLYDLCETRGILRQYDDALRAGRACIALQPDRQPAYSATGWVLALMGDFEQARQIMTSCPGEPNVETRITRFQIAYNGRDLDGALREAGQVPEFEGSQYVAACRPYFEALVYQAQGREDLARPKWEAARDILAAQLTAEPTANVVSASGVVRVALGDAQGGVAEAERALTVFPADRDVWIREWRLNDLAYAQTLAGRTGDAIATLEGMLAAPGNSLSRALLRSTPAFDTLRDDDRFTRLLDDGS